MSAQAPKASAPIVIPDTAPSFLAINVSEENVHQYPDTLLAIEPGQVVWVSFDADVVVNLCNQGRPGERAKWLTFVAGKSGVYLHAEEVGNYMRVQRLRHGPATKLSHWYDMLPGERMLQAVDASDMDIELALFRAGYVRRSFGMRFTVDVSDGGQLWINRVDGDSEPRSHYA